MSSRRGLALLLAPCFLVVLSSPAFSQPGARLKVCNTGEVPVEVAVALSAERLLVNDYWLINPYTIGPGDCAIVYKEVGPRQYYCDQQGNPASCNNPPVEALLGFGFKDAAKQIVSLEATPPPNLGVYNAMYAFTERKVLAWDSRPLCVDRGMQNRYATKDSKLTDVCDAGFVPLRASYDFYPDQAFCGGVSVPGVRPPGCVGGNYLLNVAAIPANREVDVTGSRVSDDFKPVAPDPAVEKMDQAARDALKKGIADLIQQGKEEEAKRREAADPMNQAAANRKIYEARANSIDYAAEHTRNIGRIRELSEFSPAWLRSADPVMYVRGTVSHVEMPAGPRQPARLYFKESPDNAFVACIPVPQLWDTARLQQYAGKYLEVRGRVSQSNCGGKVADVQIGNPSMILDLANGTPSDEEALPGMTVSPPPNKGGPATFVPPPPGPDRNDRVSPAQRPRNDVPRQPPPAPSSAPSSSAAAPTAAAPPRAAATAPSPIPPGTRIEVTLMEPVDMLKANDGDTFRAQVLRAAAPGGGSALSQGAAVVLRFARTPAPGANGFNSVSLTLQSVTLNGQPVSVSSNTFATAVPTIITPGPSTTWRAGMRFFFVVSGAR